MGNLCLSPPPPPKAHQLIALDGLRALAALSVFLGHARAFFFVPWQELPNSEKNIPTTIFYLISRSTSEAVLVFFVLSGFFVGGQIFNRFETSRWNVREYIIDRATRMYLPLIPSLIYSCIIGYAVLGKIEDPLSPLSSLFLLNDVIWPTTSFDPPLWTITYEMWFYILLPSMIYLYIGRPRLIVLSLVILGISVFVRLHAAFLLFWLLGSIIYKSKNKLSSRMVAGVGFSILITSYIYFETHRGEGKILARDQLIYCQSFICAGFSLMIPYLSSSEVNNKLRIMARPFSRLADYSYTLYLFHYPTLCLMSFFVRPSPNFEALAILRYIGGLGICFAMCVFWWHIFERQTGHVRRILKYRFVARESMSTGFAPQSRY